MKWIRRCRSTEPLRLAEKRFKNRSTRKSEAESEGWMAATKIVVRNDGSLRVDGDFEMVDQDRQGRSGSVDEPRSRSAAAATRNRNRSATVATSESASRARSWPTISRPLCPRLDSAFHNWLSRLDLSIPVGTDPPALARRPQAFIPKRPFDSCAHTAPESQGRAIGTLARSDGRRLSPWSLRHRSSDWRRPGLLI